jgi:O-antigen/teichoic acid export membrane protein
VFTGFVFFGTIHSAFLAEPMLVLGSQAYRRAPTSYVRSLCRWHWLMTSVMGLILALVAIVLAIFHSPFAPLLGMLVWAAPSILFLWLMRQACYFHGKARWAALVGLLYLVIIGALLAGLMAAAILSPATGFLALGLASLICGGLLWRLNAYLEPAEALGSEAKDRAIRFHVTYGRSSSISAVLSWSLPSVPQLLLPAFAGLGSAGVMRALGNLSMPVAQTLSAVSRVMTMSFAAELADDGKIRSQRRYYRLCVGGAVLAGLGVIFYGRLISRWLYGPLFAPTNMQLLILAASMAINGHSAVKGSILRAHNRPELMVRALAYAAAATIVGVIPALRWWGLTGGLVCIAGASFIAAASMHRFAAALENGAAVATEVELGRPAAEVARAEGA